MKNTIRAAFILLFCLFFVTMPFTAFAEDDPPAIDSGSPAMISFTPITPNIYTLRSMNDLSFLCSDVIISVEIDGVPLTNPTFFSLSANGMTLTLYASFLEQFSPGTYSIIVNTATGGQGFSDFSIRAGLNLTVTGSDPHIIGSGTGLVFTSSEPICSFDFDGTQLTEPTSYSLQGDSVILSPVFLNQLSPGKYSVGVYNAAGEYASASFTIKAGPTLTATGSTTHTRYSMTDLSFTCSDSITTVIVDGAKLTANFSLSEDGTTVTLSAGFLDQLTPGEHTISVYVYNPMEIQTSTTFFIEAVMTLTATGSNTYTLYSMNDLNFECNEVIENAYVGGQLLDSAYCGISPDGKTITLYAALLNQLRADNSYTLKVYNSAGDSADATFRIEDCPLLVPGVPMAADSKQPLRFIAPNDGYYNFYFLNADNTRYEFQYLDAQKGTWRNTPSMRGRKYVKNEVIYLRPMYNQTTEGKLDVLVREITPPTQNSIEVGDAYNVTNSSMTLDFTLNVTGNSADNGYSIGLMVSWEDSPNFGPGANTSRYSYQGAYAVRNNETWTLTIGSFVPEQSFYYKAILLQNGNILAQGSTIHSVQFNSDLTGFEQLTLNTPYTMTNLGEAHFYFEAPTDGVYAVEADGISSINVKDNGGYPVRGTSGQSDFLCGTPIKAGERIYIGSAQNTGQSGSVAVYEGQKKLPEVTVGTQSVEQPNGIRTIPMYFIAPEDGEYSFTTNSAAYMRIMDETGNFLYRRGIYYRASLLKDQVIWIDGMERASGDTLTIVHETIPLRKLTFSAGLTRLENEACRGLNIDDVVFGDKIQSIGNKAFADCPNLRRVEIPVADVDIADNAFDNSPNVILYAPIGGSVEQFAAKHRIMLEAMIP